MIRRLTASPPRLAHVVLLALTLWGGEFLRRDLWEPDEARYAYVAREMRTGGHWAVPHRHGEPYAHKPPLMFWLMQAGSLLTGGHITSVSARLPSLLGAVLSLWVVARLMLLWTGRADAAWRAVLILATSFLFWKQGGMGQIDALLCGLQMTAMYFLFTAKPPRAARRAAAAYACMGLAVLAKGPVGFFVPLGAYAAATAAAGQGRLLRQYHWLWGPLVTLAFPAAWLAWAWLSGAPPAYFAELLLHQNAGRVAGSFGGHHRSLIYYFWHFPLDFLPWTLLLPAACTALHGRTGSLALRRGMQAWMLFVILFFTIPVSKRHLYILLAFPPASMLVAAGFDLLDRRRHAWCAYTLAGVCALLAAAAAAAAFRPDIPLPGYLLAPPAVFAAAGAACLVRRFRRDGYGMPFFTTAAAIFFGLQVYVGAAVYPALNAVKTPAAMVERMRPFLPPDGPLLLYRFNGEIQALYAGMPGEKVLDPMTLRRRLRDLRRGVVVMEGGEWDRIDGHLRLAFTPHFLGMGHKTLVWCTFDLYPNAP